MIVEGAPMLGGNSGPTKRVAMVGACGSRESPNGALIQECREGGIVEEYSSTMPPSRHAWRMR